MNKYSFKELSHFTPIQQEALALSKKHKFLLYGGQMGGGKSYFLRWGCLYWLLYLTKKYNLRNIRAGLFCEDYPSLKDRQISKIQFEFPTWLGKMNKLEHEFVLDKRFGGGVICFRNLDEPSKYKSAEFAIIAIDELTMDKKEVFDLLRTRLRWTPIDKPRFLAGTNPGGIGHCVPFGEVLTDKGWKEIKDVKINDFVATSDKNERLIYLPVSQKWEEQYNGKLYDFNSATATIICTPNHKIVRRTHTKNKKGRIYHKPSLIKIKDISEYNNFVRSSKKWEGQEIKQFIVPKFFNGKTKLNQPKEIRGDDYCALMGWFLSEGYTLDRDKEFSISQCKIENRKIIKELLDRIGFKYRISKDGFHISSPDWWAYLRQFGKCRDKFIPNEIKNSSAEQLKIFWKSAMLGDGHGSHYYTISKQLADDMQEIGLKMRFSPSIRDRQRKNRIGLSYDINFKSGKDGWLEKRKIKQVDYSGNVYCLGIDDLHRFFIRQNGNIWLSGNSWVRKLWLKREFEEFEEEQKEFVFIPAKAEDNPYLAASYIKSLKGLPEKMRKAYAEGNWDAFEGQFFSEWEDKVHTCQPFKIPPHWLKFRAIDFGRTDPFVCLWLTVNEKGRIYAYREYYQAGRDADDNAKMVIAMTPRNEHIEWTVADSSIFDKTGHGKTIAETLRENGLVCYPSEKKRIPGWILLHQHLRWNEIDKPNLVFFKNCLNSIRTIPELIHDKNVPEDLDSSGEDHCADTLRYFLQALRGQRAGKAQDPMIARFFKSIKSTNFISNMKEFYNSIV